MFNVVICDNKQNIIQAISNITRFEKEGNGFIFYVEAIGEIYINLDQKGIDIYIENLLIERRHKDII